MWARYLTDPSLIDRRYRAGPFAITSFLREHFMVAAWRCARVAGRSRVELVIPHRRSCSDFRDHVPVKSNEVRRAAQWPPWAGPPRRRTPATGSFLCTACLSDFRVGSPARGWHSGACRRGLQQLAHHTRTVWSARHMDHRGDRIRCDIITSRARQLEMCGTALLSLQGPRVLCISCQHSARQQSRR